MAITLKYGHFVDKYLQIVPDQPSLAEALIDTVKKQHRAAKTSSAGFARKRCSELFGGLRGNKRPVPFIGPMDPALEAYTVRLFFGPGQRHDSPVLATRQYAVSTRLTADPRQ